MGGGVLQNSARRPFIVGVPGNVGEELGVRACCVGQLLALPVLQEVGEVLRIGPIWPWKWIGLTRA